MRLLLLTAIFVMSGLSLKADPNNADQCGQFNAYMSHLCQQDNMSQSKNSVIPECSECYSSGAGIADSTTVRTQEGSKGQPGSSSDQDSAQ